MLVSPETDRPPTVSPLYQKKARDNMSLALGDAVIWDGIPFEKPVIPANEVSLGRPGPEGRKASPAFGRPMRDMLLIPQ